jgi:hypothetical protein
VLWAFSEENDFEFRDIGTPAGVPISHFHSRSRDGKTVFAVPLPAEARHRGKVIFFSAGQKANADCLYDPSREKAIRENPQIFPNRKL